MTDKIKEKLDKEMRSKWKKYVNKELGKGDQRGFQHINGIIESDHFIKVYLNNRISIWLFILCDGEYGLFDGYSWYEYIPRAIAEYMGAEVLNLLNGSEFKEVDGKFYIKHAIA